MDTWMWYATLGVLSFTVGYFLRDLYEEFKR